MQELEAKVHLHEAANEKNDKIEQDLLAVI
jgi:hypothetical protein